MFIPSAMCVDTENLSNWSDKNEYWAQETEDGWEKDESSPENESDQAKRTKRLRHARDRKQALLRIVCPFVPVLQEGFSTAAVALAGHA